MASLPLAWRNAIRDSDLDSNAKLAGHTLSTYMDSRGKAFPGVATLAARASVDVRTMKRAIGRLEQREFLRVDRTKGGRLARGKSATNNYFATFPTGATSAGVNGGISAPVNGDIPCSSTGSLGADLTGASAHPEVEGIEIEKEEVASTATDSNMKYLPCVEPNCDKPRVHNDRCGPHAMRHTIASRPIKKLDDLVGDAA